MRQTNQLLRVFVIAAGVGVAILFIVVGLSFELQMFGDGSIFSYAVAAQDAWTFHWHNISGRLFSYIFAYVPAETYVAMTQNAKGGIFVYGALHFAAPLLGLIATWATDRTPRHVIFIYACLSTACVCPLVFGFPTEMWMAHALFWPAFALCLYAPATVLGFVAMFFALLALVFTHEGAIVLAATVLVALFLRGGRDALFIRALAAFSAAMVMWLIVRIALPPDDYISPVMATAAYRFIDIWNLEQPAFVLLLTALLLYAGIAFVLRRLDPARAYLYAAGICAIALAIYYARFDRWLLTDARYELRTVLLIATPLLGFAAALQAMHEEDWRKSPFPDLAWLAVAVKQHVNPQPVLGAISLTLLIHVVETTKFVRASQDYKAAVRALATGTDSDPALGNPLFVSSKRIGADLNRLAWNSTTPYLSVLVAPGLAPTRLVVDPDTGYFWLSCATATKSAETSTAIPAQGRQLIKIYSCLHRS